ncbi:hypothetical protein [Brevibacterium sp. 2SA]|uniref:hypothetical protein n=1 Tax=Brevibacterium sp. 2SA TaxID=2502198 RepID=UPI0010F4CDCF|nr:hypothetical protein [Brevibacterium sp. 2SA]
MSTTFAFTFPRRVALSAGLRLVRWARRPHTAVTQRDVDRRIAEVSSLAAREELARRRERDVARYLWHVRPFV